MIPVILSGGSGQRLWPISRKNTPKQFCQFLNEPLLELTLKRLYQLEPALIISNINLKIPTENILNKSEIPADVLYEPLAKNTAPAIALAVKYLHEKKKANDWICVMPSDHIIENTDLLTSTLNKIETSDDSSIYLLGINPTEAKTGFGYIEVDDYKLNDICSVKKFHEKPDKKTAEHYLNKPNFLWNSGIFVFKPQTLIDYFESTQSQIWNVIDSITNFHQFSQTYEKVTANSFDYEVLEHFNQIKCIPLDLNWSDVGTWDEFAKVIPQTTSYANELVEIESSNNYIYSNDKKVISTIGVDNLIIVDSTDSLLICKKGQSEKVKQSVKLIENKSIVQSHNLELKPWGYFKVLLDEPHQKIKKICVYPNQQLSYQTHKNRNENWTLTKGSGVVTLEGKKTTLKVGDSISISMGQKHRISNIKDVILEFIEVQTGSYFGEDDIIRFEDDYGRADKNI